MIKADVTLDSTLLLRIQTFLKENGADALPNTKAAFTDAARAIQEAWHFFTTREIAVRYLS